MYIRQSCSRCVWLTLMQITSQLPSKYCEQIWPHSLPVCVRYKTCIVMWQGIPARRRNSGYSWTISWTGTQRSFRSSSRIKLSFQINSNKAKPSKRSKLIAKRNSGNQRMQRRNNDVIMIYFLYRINCVDEETKPSQYQIMTKP